jgi:hypothetical protein
MVVVDGSCECVTWWPWVALVVLFVSARRRREETRRQTHAPPSSEMLLKSARSRFDGSEGQKDVATMVLRLRDVGGCKRGSRELAGFMWLELPAPAIA